MDGVKVYELTEQKICPGSYDFTWDGTMKNGNYEGMPDGEEPTNIAPEGLYTFDVEVTGVAPYDHDWLRSKELKVVLGAVEELGVDEETGDHFYSVRYFLIDRRNASKGTLYLYDPNLEILQTWDVSGLLCLDHEAKDGLVANPEGQQHALLVRIPKSILKPGQHYFVLNFTDNSSDIMKNHTDKMTLHIGHPMTVVYQVEDFDFYATVDYLYANKLLTQDEIITIRVVYPCPPKPPNALPLVGDIDGDRTTDWDYPGDRRVPETNYVVGVFGIRKGIYVSMLGSTLFINRGSYYLLTIGTDRNNDGLLQINEIEHWIGYCPYPYGVNSGWIQREKDGRWYVHWTSYNDYIRTDGNPSTRDYEPIRDLGEPMIHFIYDPYRNILKVYTDDGNGNKRLAYQGSPENYPWWPR